MLDGLSPPSKQWQGGMKITYNITSKSKRYYDRTKTPQFLVMHFVVVKIFPERSEFYFPEILIW